MHGLMRGKRARSPLTYSTMEISLAIFLKSRQKNFAKHYVTVINVITPTARKASGNTHQYIGVR